MPRRLAVVGFVTAMIFTACGGSADPVSDAVGGTQSSSETSVAVGAGDDIGSEAQASSADGTFELCSVIEEHRVELASVLGFEADLEEAVDVSFNKCKIKGTGDLLDSASVELIPEGVSLSTTLSGWGDRAAPASELGDDAAFVADDLIPHVIFLVGDHVIDVHARVTSMNDGIATSALSRDTMIAYALRVRELLAEASS